MTPEDETFRDFLQIGQECFVLIHSTKCSRCALV